MPEKKFSLSAHIFTRDLRIDDNPALSAALGNSETTIPCFAIERELIIKNSRTCDSRLEFLYESLAELSAKIEKTGGKLNFYSEGAVKLAEDLCKNGVEAVYTTRDYTPYAIERERLIEKICNDSGCSFFNMPGSLLNEPEEIQKENGAPYKIFTPFFRKASLIPVPEPENCNFSNFSREDLLEDSLPESIIGSTLSEIIKTGSYKGGSSEGLKLIENIKNLKNYEDEKDFPALKGTSNLSAHIRFGTVSVREFYHKVHKMFGPDHALIRQLYWRDFFTHIAFHYPYVFKGPFQRRYESMPWNENKELFRSWCRGMTGFPFIDAGMREMNETGFMHNRVRMAAASFLVKDLHIDWRWGEKYFASKLNDYDPSVNNGNWQWSASTGCDAQPYFRIFNPWLQQKKFDPDCIYIRRWIPELSGIEPDEIHNLYRRRTLPPDGYPSPLVDHKTEALAARAIYSETV